MSHTGLPIEITFPVAWGQMDAFQHLNNVVYFRYFEDARIAYFEKVGMLERMEAEGEGPILASTQCRYRIPITYPDQVSVGSCVRELTDGRFTMYYRVYSHEHDAIAAEGTGTIVYFSYREKRKAQMPQTLVSAIQDVEDGKATMEWEGKKK